MSRQPATTAKVIDLAAAREAADCERLSDGRRKGDHGNRASDAMKAATVQSLRDILEVEGVVTREAKEEHARRAGVSVRAVNRWWAAALDDELAALEAVDEPVDLPRYLYRHQNAQELQLTADEAAFFAQHHHIKDAIDKVRSDPTHRLSHYGRSTLYRAFANIAAPVREGARNGGKAQGRQEATYPMTGRETLNETWSIDEYDLKIRAFIGRAEFHPKVLIVRERLSGLPLAYKVLRQAATGVDTGVVLAAAAIGYTVTDPHDPESELRVSGVPRHLISDQGGSFIGETGLAAARRLGIGINPTPTYRPQANGDHEQMHQSLLAHFIGGAGSRRGWEDRTGTRLDHGTLPWVTVLEEVDRWFLQYINTPFTKGDRTGRTRLQVYADNVAAGNVHKGHQLGPADEAAVAEVVGERKYDPTRGVVWENREWISRDLAAAGAAKQKITLKQLLDPDLLYAFDHRDRFIGILQPREFAVVDDVLGVHQDRARRARFVEQRVAKPRQAAALADAEAAQREVAEGLAAAQEAAQSALSAQDAASIEGTEAHVVVQPTVTRRTPKPERRRGDASAGDASDQVADAFRTARRPSATPNEAGDDDAQ